MTPQTAAERLYRQLVEDEVRDPLREAGVLDTLRDFARLSGDTRGLVPTLQSAISAALNYESMVRAGTLDMVPEWVRTQEAAE